MSQILYVLVVLQGTTLSFSPGYTTAAECMQQYTGPHVSCFPSGIDECGSLRDSILRRSHRRDASQQKRHALSVPKSDL